MRLRAQLRALTNVGISFGALLGGAALAADTRPVYVAMILANGATFVIAALIVATLPAYPSTRRRDDGHRRWLALLDGPYLMVTAVNAVISLNYGVLVVGLPLWVSTRTSVPRFVVAALMLLNTVAIVTLQVRVSRGVSDPGTGARGLRRAGIAFAAAWCLIGAAGGGDPGIAVAVLFAGVALHTLGELWQAAASFELSFSLAHAEAQGQYQGVFGLGQGLADALAPLLAAGVCVAAGLAGWAAAGLTLAQPGRARRPPSRGPSASARGGWLPEARLVETLPAG